MARDAARLFNYMTGYARPEQMEKIGFAPVTLRPTLYSLIDTEIANARAGKPALNAAPGGHRDRTGDAAAAEALVKAASATIVIVPATSAPMAAGVGSAGVPCE